MRRSTAIAILALGIAAILGLSVSIGSVVAQPEIVTLDEQTPLTHDSTVEQWQQENPVNVSTTQLQMDIGIARDPETVNVSGLTRTGLTTLYLRVDYDETIPRTVRFYVPDEYWTPYPDRSVGAVGGGATASFSPTANQTHTAVTIDFNGETSAVFPVNQRAAWAFAARYQVNDYLSNATGLDLPTLSAGEQWKYIEPEQLASDDGRAAIEATDSDILVQFDADLTNATRWENARACSDSERRVCTFTVSGDQRTYVMSRAADAPRVRYKLDASWTDGLFGGWNELTGLAEDAFAQLDEVIPW